MRRTPEKTAACHSPGGSRRRKTVYVAVRTDLDLRPCHRDPLRVKARFYHWNEKDPLFDYPNAVKLNAYLLP